MKIVTLVSPFLLVTGVAMASTVCPNAPLTTYINGGSFYACTEDSGALTVKFNHDVLPSYAGVNVLSSNNSAADPAAINVVPAATGAGLEFDSSAFSESGGLLSPLTAQAEVVHFLIDAGSQDITQTTLSLDNLQINGGIGAAVAVGQELVCVGGTFTSLPTGILTSVLNGVVGGGALGCNGVTLVGTVGASSGLLNLITGDLGLLPYNTLSDNVAIQLAPYDPDQLDIIKIQALATVLTGSVSDTGFGNTYTLSSGSVGAAPEPGSFLLMGLGLVLVSNPWVLRKIKAVRS